jgi:hypothetical protein
MRKLVYLYHIVKALIFRAIIFIPFECFGYLNVRSAASKSRTKRLAFQAYNPQTAQVFLPIIDEFRKHAEIEIWFVVMFHPYHGARGLTQTRAFAINELGIKKDNVLFIWESFWCKFDALVCSDVYAKFPIRKTNKIIIPHGAGLLSRWVKKNPLRKTVSDFDAYLICGEFDHKLAQDRVNGKTKLYRVGFPFVDVLFNDSSANKSPDRAISKKEKKTVLYAPSWGHTYHYGDILSRNIEAVMECLREKEVSILLKLHNASFIPAQARGIVWQKRIQRYLAWGSVQIIHELNDIPSFKTADILITDISSRSLNFMITDKPVVIYGVPDSFSETDIENIRINKIYEGGYRAKDPFELAQVVGRCLEHAEEMSPQRRKVVAEVFSNPGCAASEMVQCIAQELENS